MKNGKQEKRLKFLEKFDKKLTAMSRVLKCHMILEFYMKEHFVRAHGLTSLNGGKYRLRFYDLSNLLSLKEDLVWQKAIFELNSVRNDFGHDIEFVVQEKHIQQMKKMIRLDYPKFKGDCLMAVEFFTALACMHFAEREKD